MNRRFSFLVLVSFIISMCTIPGEILAAPYYEGKTIVLNQPEAILKEFSKWLTP